MNTKLKMASLILVLVAIAGSGFLGWAKYKTSIAKVTLKPALVDSVEFMKIDTVKIELLKQVYGKLNLNKSEFLIVGSMTAKNGADTTDRLNSSPYIFSRKGTSFYFKLGTTESINAKGLYVYIDHKIKKVLLSREKEVSGFVMPELETILKTVGEEGFQLKSTIKEGNECITLSNPYHLSCKEYSVSFNKFTLKPYKLYVRLSNAENPENNDKDSVIDFRIERSSGISEIDVYTAQHIVVKGNSGWSLGPGFKNYELINTL